MVTCRQKLSDVTSAVASQGQVIACWQSVSSGENRVVALVSPDAVVALRRSLFAAVRRGKQRLCWWSPRTVHVCHLHHHRRHQRTPHQ